MQTFTIEQIKNYLNTQDSLGDIHYNLTDANVIEANNPNTGEMVESNEVEVGNKYWFEGDENQLIMEVVDNDGWKENEFYLTINSAILLADEGRLFHVKEQFK